MENNQQSFDYMRYVRLILKRKRLFGILALAIMFLVAAGSYFVPKKYEAKSTVFIEENVIANLVKGIAITPSVEAKIRVLQVAMLSRSMLLDVIRELDMDLGAENIEALIAEMRKQTSISLHEKRGYFTISFTHESPAMARDFVNTLVRKYIEENTSSKREESITATRFLSEQINLFKGRIDKAEAEINAFKQDKGLILSTDSGMLRKEIDDSQERLEELRIRKTELEAAKNLMERGQADPTGLAAMKKQLRDLRTTYSDIHPDVVALQRRIADLENPEVPTDAAAAQDEQARRDALEDTPEYQKILVELQAIERMERRLNRTIEENRQLLRQLPVVRAQLTELESVKNNELLIYNQLVSRYGQSEVSTQMELQDKSVSFRIIDPAVLPQHPVSPNRPLIIAGGILGGLGLAFGVVFLLDFLNGKIKSVRDLKAFKYPVLAVIPVMSDPARERRRRRRDLRFYFVAGTLFTCVLAVLALEVLGAGLIDRAVNSLPFTEDIRNIVGRLPL